MTGIMTAEVEIALIKEYNDYIKLEER